MCIIYLPFPVRPEEENKDASEMKTVALISFCFVFHDLFRMKDVSICLMMLVVVVHYLEILSKKPQLGLSLGPTGA